MKVSTANPRGMTSRELKATIIELQTAKNWGLKKIILTDSEDNDHEVSIDQIKFYNELYQPTVGGIPKTQ